MSQTGYIFSYGDTIIFWRSTKQSLVATSSNHVKLLTLHEKSGEYVWLRSLVYHIRESYSLLVDRGNLTTLYEDNETCIT